MAYEALETLVQTLDSLDQFLNYGDHLIITPTVRQEIVAIRLQAVVLQMNLKHYPYKQRIIRAANTTSEIIEYLFSEENLSDGVSREVNVELADKLRELAEKLESTAGDVVDFIMRKDARPPTASSSRPATTTSKDLVIGFDEDAEVIKGRLVNESCKLPVLSIVGPGGIGKTTLAKTVYNHAFVMDYFHIRGWVTISQDYSVANTALKLLASMEGISEERDVEREVPIESLIREYLCERRYLIVIDDICSKKAWDDLHMLFPDSNNGSRIIVTTRLQDVAAYVSSSSCIHTMRLLDARCSWKLLKKKVFADADCPVELEDIGKKIAKNCGGLPLLIVLVAGLLSKIRTRDFWKQIAANGAQLDTIICSSFSQLRDDSKQCFLYMAGFPEDYEIHVSELVKLWISEGFIKDSNQSKSLEEEAKKCVEDLVERSLVLVVKKNFEGEIKSCSLHDIVRDFCVRQARKEKVILPVMDYLPTPILRSHFLPRLIKDHPRISATSYDLHLKDSMHNSHTRTIICIPMKGYRPVGSVEKFNSVRVLHVLRRSNHWDWEPGRVFDLVHLTYLASNIPNNVVPSAISKLQNLQTLIIYRSGVLLPAEIWTLWQLRHLIAFSFDPLPHPEENAIPLENLETLSLASNFMCSERMVKMIPNIKKLGICYPMIFYSNEKFGADYRLNNLEHLCRLEKLKLEMHLDVSFTQIEMEMQIPVGLLYGRLDGLEMRLNELELKVCGGFPSRTQDEIFEMEALSRQLDEFEPEMFSSLSFGILIRDPNHAFPLALRRLTLSGWRLSWSGMKVIGSLPNLQVLKLRNYACRGLRWKTNEGEFGELRLLLIEKSTLRYWRTQGSHVFPKLECLMLHLCPYLSEIPSNIGGIPTLKLIEVDERHKVLLRSAKAIVNKQQSSGNDSFQVRVKRS